MNTVLLIARLVLALVFVVAGISKLADRKGSRHKLGHEERTVWLQPGLAETP